MNRNEVQNTVYPAINRVFLNGIWIGDQMFSGCIDISDTTIDLGTILGMNPMFSIHLCTPSSSIIMCAEGLRINFKEFTVELLEYDETYPGVKEAKVVQMFTFMNSFLLINKESGDAFMIEVMPLPVEFNEPSWYKTVKFPYWFTTTTCCYGRPYVKTVALINSQHEPFAIGDREYNAKSVRLCETRAEYLNISNESLKSSDGIVTGKLVTFDVSDINNEIFMVDSFNVRYIDGLVAETTAIELSSVVDDDTLTLPINDFIDKINWVSPFSPYDIDHKIITMVTSDEIFQWESGLHGAKVKSFNHTDEVERDEFFLAYDFITSQISNVDTVDIGSRLMSITAKYMGKERLDLILFVIPDCYGGGILKGSDINIDDLDLSLDYEDYYNFNTNDTEEGDNNE